MQLRNSISNTKKFFQKTLQSFKFFFSAAEPYQKLPKSSPYNPIPFTATAGIDLNPQTSNYQDLEKFYIDFTDHRWGSSDGGIIGKTKKMRQKQNMMSSSDHKVVKRQDEDCSYSKSKREAKSLSVAKKLKELEMMDMNNVDHVFDIEEVLHYYSRLTCPAYLDIVDKFFMDVYTEFLGNSRPKFRSVRA